MYECTSVRVYECTSVRVYKCTSVRVFDRTIERVREYWVIMPSHGRTDSPTRPTFTHILDLGAGARAFPGRTTWGRWVRGWVGISHTHARVHTHTKLYAFPGRTTWVRWVRACVGGWVSVTPTHAYIHTHNYTHKIFRE